MYLISKCFATKTKKRLTSNEIYNLDLDVYEYWPFEPTHPKDFKKLTYYGVIEGRNMHLNFVLFMSGEFNFSCAIAIAAAITLCGCVTRFVGNGREF